MKGYSRIDIKDVRKVMRDFLSREVEKTNNEFLKSAVVGLFAFAHMGTDGVITLSLYTNSNSRVKDFKRQVKLPKQLKASETKPFVESFAKDTMVAFFELGDKVQRLEGLNLELDSLFQEHGFEQAPIQLIYTGKGRRVVDSIVDGVVYLNVNEERYVDLVNSLVANGNSLKGLLSSDDVELFMTAPNVVHLICAMDSPIEKLLSGLRTKGQLSIYRLLQSFNSNAETVITGSRQGMTYTVEMIDGKSYYAFYIRDVQGLRKVFPLVDCNTLLYKSEVGV